MEFSDKLPSISNRFKAQLDEEQSIISIAIMCLKTH